MRCIDDGYAMRIYDRWKFWKKKKKDFGGSFLFLSGTRKTKEKDLFNFNEEIYSLIKFLSD